MGDTKAERKELQAGEILCQEGAVPDGLFCLITGEISVWREGVEIGSVNGQGEILGEMSLITGNPRSATLQAKVASEVLHVKRSLHEIRRRIPDLFHRLRATFVTRLEMTQAKVKIYEHLFSTARRILLHEILCEERGAVPGRATEAKARTERQRIRRWIEETIASGASPNDPRPLDRLAMQEGVNLKYQEELKNRYGHLLNLAHKTEEADGLMRLGKAIETEESLVHLAQALEVMTGVLASYENDPAPKMILDRLRLEEIIPFSHRVEILKRLYVVRCLKPSERGRPEKERPFWQKVDEAKISAGSDLVALYDAAETWGLGEEFEAELKRTLARAEISSTIGDLEVRSRL